MSDIYQQRSPESEFVDATAADGKFSRERLAERYVIGSVLKRPELAPRIVAELSETDFRDSVHRVVYRSIRRILGEKREVCVTSVFEDIVRMGDRQEFGDSGPASFLADAYAFPITGMDYDYMAMVVRDLAKKRAIAFLLNEIDREIRHDAKTAERGPFSEWTREPAEDISNRFARKLTEIGTATTEDTRTVSTASQTVTSVLLNIDRKQRERRLPSDGPKLATKFGIPSIDEVIEEIEPGALVVVAARPGVGKSAFAGSIVRNQCEARKHVLFFSLEMPQEQLAARMLANVSGVHLAKTLGRADMNEIEAESVRYASQSMSEWPLTFYTKRGVTSEKIAADVIAHTTRHGRPGMIVVDYLQLIKPVNSRDNRNYQVGLDCKNLRNVAGEAGCPLILLAQLNRQSEIGSRMPRMSDLRDSGEIEQDADVVIFLHNSDETSYGPRPVSVIIAKQRNGQTKTVGLEFDPTTQTFKDQALPGY